MATTTYYLSGISLVLQYLTNLGLMAAGGQVYTYVGGSVGTAVTTYTDSTGLVANANPMTLNSAGRPASASGAPVAFWVPGGTTVQLQVFDASGNQLVFLDNVPAINDLTNSTTALQALLASAVSSNVAGAGPVAGADLVANAVKSYDIFADVRAANAPILVTGQTLNIEVQGASAVGDGLGGFFYWNAASTSNDDGRTVLKPTSVSASGAGRWLRYYPLGVPQIIVKTAAQQVVSSTTLTPDTQLTTTLLANATYLVQARLQLLGIGGTGQGWKAAIAYTGTIAAGGTGVGIVSGNGTPVATLNAIASSPGAMSNAALADVLTDAANIDYILQTGTSGTLTVEFAQDSSSANATQMNVGSALIITRLA
jgi:hypothetical protein